MGLEVGTFLQDLNSGNPQPTDDRSVGDDHIRLIKSTLLATFPNATRAQYFARSASKTADYIVVAADMEKTFLVDATAGAVQLTLPTLSASNDGWTCSVEKSDTTANIVTVVGTINGDTNQVLRAPYEKTIFLWTGTAWLSFRALQIRGGMAVLPLGSTAARPATPAKGGIWYNDTTSLLEFGDGTNFIPLLTSLLGAQMPYGAVINGTLVESHVGNAATFALKTLAGADPSVADPVLVAFRDPTVATGGYVFRKVTAALSLTISSGSTMGFTSAVAGRLWFTLFDDAGTVRMGVINCLSGLNIYPLGQAPLASSTAEGGVGAADSAHTFYTGVAVTTKSYTILGYADYNSGLVTAGSWAVSPSKIQLFGAGVPLPGQRVQRVRQTRTDYATGFTAIPVDNTIPQNTEGDQYFSQAITPTAAPNVLNFFALVNFTSTGAGAANNVFALFQDTTANALAVSQMTSNQNQDPIQASFGATLLAGVIVSTTFKLRIGNANGRQIYLNGNSGSGLFNGTCTSFLDIEEIMA